MWTAFAQASEALPGWAVGGSLSAIVLVVIYLLRHVSQDRSSTGMRETQAWMAQLAMIKTLTDRVTKLEDDLEEQERDCQRRLDGAYKEIRELRRRVDG